MHNAKNCLEADQSIKIYRQREKLTKLLLLDKQKKEIEETWDRNGSKVTWKSQNNYVR